MTPAKRAPIVLWMTALVTLLAAAFLAKQAQEARSQRHMATVGAGTIDDSLSDEAYQEFLNTTIAKSASPDPALLEMRDLLKGDIAESRKRGAALYVAAGTCMVASLTLASLAWYRTRKPQASAQPTMTDSGKPAPQE